MGRLWAEARNGTSLFSKNPGQSHYQAVIDKFDDVEPNLSIQAAEERHSDALIRQLVRLVDVPDNPYLGTITAPQDLATAAAAWAEGEVANIAMHDLLLTETTDPALANALGNLRAASLESHLPSFKATAENGGTLTAEQMAEFNDRDGAYG